jgi:hypothetical protein
MPNFTEFLAPILTYIIKAYPAIYTHASPAIFNHNSLIYIYCYIVVATAMSNYKE